MAQAHLLLVAAYLSLPALRFIEPLIAGEGPDPSGVSTLVYFGIPGVLAVLVGWNSEWARGVLHALLMAVVALLAYLAADLVGWSGAHSEPVSTTTAPWYYLAFLTVFVPGVIVGRLAHLALRPPR